MVQNDEDSLVLAGNPSLICPNDDLGGKLSKYTVSDTTKGNGALDKKKDCLLQMKLYMQVVDRVIIVIIYQKIPRTGFGGLCLRATLMATMLSFGLFLAMTASLTATPVTAATSCAPLYHFSRESK